MRTLFSRLRAASGLLLLLPGLPALGASPVISPAAPSVHCQTTLKFSITQNGKPVTTGLWYVIGGLQNGNIDQDGTYHAPFSLPSPNVVTLQYIFDPGNGTGLSITKQTLTVTNPVPGISRVTPATITQLSTPLWVLGGNFLPGTVITVNGQDIPTTVENPNSLRGTAVLTSPKSSMVTIGVKNPAPGSSIASVQVRALFPVIGWASPVPVRYGWNTFVIHGANFTSDTVALLDGRPMQTTLNSATQVTAAGYLPGWRVEKTAAVSVAAGPGSPASWTSNLNVAPLATSYDAAARFSTQAALGPRPAIVERIQAIGLPAFVAEQLKQPGLPYSDPGMSPRLALLSTAASTNSVLRLRLALAFNTFIPNQSDNNEYAATQPWERKLEADVTGNYRKLMDDLVSDARLTSFLNLPGNRASMDPNLHPNQNFSREFLQLFTLGTDLLHDDGTVQTDGAGNVLPTYGQDTILDFSRALTGWELPPPVNPTFTAAGIDESQPLVAHDEYHDHGAKTLFGTVHLPAGQSTVQDRTMALDAIFAHPNLPPFVAKLLITRLVTSNPSPAYVERIAGVFKNNGKGVRGDLSAVVTALLLDPEARAGDTAPQPDDGFLQDPVLFELFLMNTLGQSPTDSQAITIGPSLGQNWWHPYSIFDFYPHAFAVPGTTVNSPAWALFNNLTAILRSQYTYGIVSGLQPGFQPDPYMNGSWLFTAFTNLPDLIEGMNHLLYHGQMSAAEQSAILSYCAGIPDQRQQFTTAIFLALNADSYNVSH